MRKLLLVLVSLFLLASPAFAVSLQWDAPTTNADGTPIVDLASYKVYKCNGLVAGCSKTKFDQLLATIAIPTTTYLIALPDTDKTFFVTALDTSGNESAESNVLCYGGATQTAVACVDSTAPKPPTSLRVTP